jgi:hypothetical protein
MHRPSRVATHDWVGEGTSGEAGDFLLLSEGDTIEVLTEGEADGWWHGKLSSGKAGWFPAAYSAPYTSPAAAPTAVGAAESTCTEGGGCLGVPAFKLGSAPLSPLLSSCSSSDESLNTAGLTPEALIPDEGIPDEGESEGLVKDAEGAAFQASGTLPVKVRSCKSGRAKREGAKPIKGAANGAVPAAESGRLRKPRTSSLCSTARSSSSSVASSKEVKPKQKLKTSR